MTKQNNFIKLNAADEISEEDDDLFVHHRIVVDPGQALLRIDKFLTAKISNATRNKVQKAADAGCIRVNETQVKSNYRVKPNDIITVVLPDPPRNKDIIPEDIPLSIVYEDDYILIVNKSAGMVVHPGYNNYSGTLVHALTFYLNCLPSMNDEIRPGLVHRIDKDTSGLLVIGKTEEALSHLAGQFFEHRVERTYHALVWGELKEMTGTIRGNLARDLKDRRMSAVFSDANTGKNAVTHYRVLESFGFCSYIECRLETGRTHQIRAHMKHIGHPIFADEMYGGAKMNASFQAPKFSDFIKNSFGVMKRQALHAKTLGFIHPHTGEKVSFDSELPEDFNTLLERFRAYVKGLN